MADGEEAHPLSPARQSTGTPTRTPVPTVTGWPTQTSTATFPPPPTVTSWATPPTRTPPPTVTGWPTWTPIPTIPPGVTATFTPTSGPPPELLYPPDGALLPQPVAPGEWYFQWNIPGMPDCANSISISGPGGRQIVEPITDPIPGTSTRYEYRYITGNALPADALGPWTWHVTAYCHGTHSSETFTFWVQEEVLPTFTPNPTRPPVTVTPYPQPATLLAPNDGALMAQPVVPGEWYFAWNGETWSSSGDCFSGISITGPQGQSITESVTAQSGEPAYEYQYLQEEYLSSEALGPWRWQVEVRCPLGETMSQERTFWVRPRSIFTLYLPLLAGLREPP